MFSFCFCLTKIYKGIENKNHQTETDKKEYKIPSISVSRKNDAGYKYIKTLIKNNMPPPR